MPLAEKLLEILACPRCRSKLIMDEPGEGLICQPCRLFYPIKEGIPVLLVEEAKSVEDAH